MILKLLPTQIPTFWEAIKQAVVQADEVAETNRPVYLNKLLQALLNDKSQCFIRLSLEKRLLGLMVTKIITDLTTGKKSLVLQALYSWQSSNNAELQADFNFAREFAVHTECAQIVFESRHARIHEVSRLLGFTETARSFALGV